MAAPKGAKIDTVEEVVVVLYIDDPRDGEKKLAEAAPDDVEQVTYIRNLADSFKEAGMKHRLVERTTKIRTSVVEEDLT